LRRLLASLEHLTYEPLEVIVVDGPSRDDTQMVLASYAGRIKSIKCPLPNLSVSRNLGITAAAGDVVVFIDDDALPGSDDWLEQLLAPFQEDSSARVAAAGGPVLHRDTASYEFREGVTSDYALQVFNQPGNSGDGQPSSSRYVRGVRGCNCAFSRQALLEIGGFDEYYSYYLEETDVCHRLSRLGYRIEYSPTASVRHYSATSARRANPYDQAWREITRSDTYFCIKNGRDPRPLRLIKTLWLARKKHFFRDILRFARHRQVSPVRGLKYLTQWFMGLAAGFLGGTLSRRRTPLAGAGTPEFLPFTRKSPQRKLRICLLSQTLPPDPAAGGIGRYTYDLASGLHHLGHDVHIITKGDDPVSHEVLDFTVHRIANAEIAGASLFPDRPILNRNAAYSLAVFHKLLDLSRAGIVFDVVQTPNWDAEGLAVITSGIYPTVLTLHTPMAQVAETEHWPMNDDMRTCIALDKWQIVHADARCCNSWGMLESYRTKMGIHPEQLWYLYRVPHGIAPQDVQAAAPGPGGAHRLLFVGRLERRKGIHVLLDVLPNLLMRYPDWECNIVGDDTVPGTAGSTPKEQFLDRYRGSDFLKRVRFYGRVAEDELLDLYRSCDLFVAPSLFESFGLIYLEAMQFGKPVIGCRTGGVPEVIEDGVDGLLADPDNAKSLEQALERCMSDPSLRERLGSAAEHKVRDQFSYLKMAESMVSIYEEVSLRVGEQRSARRDAFRLQEIPLSAIDASEGWEERVDTATGAACLYTNESGESLAFTVAAGAVLQLEFTRHECGGVLELSTADGESRYIDLYNPVHEPVWRWQGRVDGDSGECAVELTVHAERNPASRGNEVWLREIALAGTTPGELTHGLEGVLASRTPSAEPELLRAKLAAVDAEMYVYPKSRDVWISGAILDEGIWEPLETELVMNLLKPGATFVDVGGHVGYYSVIAGKIVSQGGKVITFEPETTNHTVLTQNVQLNGLEGVVQLNKLAVWKESGTITLHETARGDNMGAHWTTESGDGPGVIQIEATSLDEFLGSNAAIDLIKIDAEGSEYMVFMGMLDLVRRSPELKIITELLFPTQHTRDLVGLIRELGLSATLIDNYSGLLKPLSHEGLIAHCDGAEVHALDLLLQKQRGAREGVSVVLIDPGRRPAVERSAQSLSRQTLAPVETIVVPIGVKNQGAATGPKDGAIKFIHRVKDNGGASARCLGVCLAQGEYVCILDAGDKLEESYLERAVEVLKKDPHAVVVHHKGLLTREPRGIVFRKSDYELVGGYQDGWTDRDLLVRFIGAGMTEYRIAGEGEQLVELSVEEISIFEIDRVKRSGEWKVRRDTVSDTDYLATSEPGALLSFEAPAGSTLHLVFLRLEWCGAVEILVAGHEPVYVDLFNSRRESQWSCQLEVAGPAHEQVRVELRVSQKNNPRSHGHEVWLRRVALITTPQAGAANVAPAGVHRSQNHVSNGESVGGRTLELRRARLRAVDAEIDVYPPEADIWISAPILDRGFMEPLGTELVMNLLVPGAIFVDVGAQVGYYSVIAGKLIAESGKVIAFEPEPVNYGLLVRNLQLNGLEGIVEPNQLAAWNERKTVGFQLSEWIEHKGAHRVSEVDPDPRGMQVEAVPLDEILGDLQRIDLIKIDVEGGEYMVLDGMRALLERLPDLKIIVEVRPTPNSRDLVRLIEECGFNVSIIDNRYQLLRPLADVSLLLDSPEVYLLLQKRPPRSQDMVTVVVVDHSTSAALAESVGSVCRRTQDDLVLEVIVVAPGPTAELADGQPEVRRLRRLQESSLASAKSLGIGLAGGDYVVLLDAGETIDENYLTHAIALLAEQANTLVIDGKPTPGEARRFVFRKKDYELTGGFEDGWSDWDLLLLFVERGMKLCLLEGTGSEIANLEVADVAPFDTSRVTVDGQWSTRRDSVSDSDYHFTDQPHASLSFEVSAGSILHLVFLRHSWCGIALLQVGRERPIGVDLYSAHPESQWSYQVGVAGSAGEQVRVELKVHKKNNPQSYGHEVWLKRALVVKPVREREIRHAVTLRGPMRKDG